MRDSDGTVIFSLGAPLTGGSKRAAGFAEKHGKPWIHLHAATEDILRKAKNYTKGQQVAARKAAEVAGKTVEQVRSVAGGLRTGATTAGPISGSSAGISHFPTRMKPTAVRAARAAQSARSGLLKGMGELRTSISPGAPKTPSIKVRPKAARAAQGEMFRPENMGIHKKVIRQPIAKKRGSSVAKILPQVLKRLL